MTVPVAFVAGLLIGWLIEWVIDWRFWRRERGDSASTMAAAAPSTPPDPDDLKRIEGIGPVIQNILNAAGITTFAQLADLVPDRLESVLNEAGFSAPFDPDSWPEQARLAADGDWDALQTLQDRLIAGREE